MSLAVSSRCLKVARIVQESLGLSSGMVSVFTAGVPDRWSVEKLHRDAGASMSMPHSNSRPSGIIPELFMTLKLRLQMSERAVFPPMEWYRQSTLQLILMVAPGIASTACTEKTLSMSPNLLVSCIGMRVVGIMHGEA